MDSRAMTPREQETHAATILVVRSAVSTLRMIGPDRNEDLDVALARLENWLAENDGRWTK